MSADILGKLTKHGLKLAVKQGRLLAEPKSRLNDETRSLIREHKAGLMALLSADFKGEPTTAPISDRGAFGMPGVSTEFQSRLSADDLTDIAAGDIPMATVQAYEQAAIAREAEDLKEHFEERAGIIEHGAGLPRPEAELEAARITATLARNRGYTCASLRAALADYPVLLSQLPDKAGPVDALPLGVATLAVLKGRRVVRQGAFTGVHEVKA